MAGRTLDVESAGDVLAKMLSTEKKASTEPQSAKTQTPPPVKAEPAEQTDEPTETAGEDDSAASPAQEQTDDTATETDAETPQPDLHVVKVDGVEEQVTLEDLKKGFSHAKYNTQQSQKNAEERKKVAAEKQAFEAEAVAVRAERQKYVDGLKQLEQFVAENEPKEPDWAKLKAEDPVNYLRLKDEWNDHRERKAAIAKARQDEESKLREEGAKAFSAYKDQELTAFIEALPEELKEPEKFTAETKKLASFAAESGFTPQEIAGVIDHRLLMMLRKAMLWDEAQKMKPKVANKIDKPVTQAKPGVGGKKGPNPLAETRKRLGKTGSLDDAAALLTGMLRADKARATKG